MSAFKIISVSETNKIWESNGVRSGQGKYPWRQLKVGESFFVPENQLPRSGSRPSPPDSVKGLFTTKRILNGKVAGVLVKRVH